MKRIIDIHSHIIPFVDDGSGSMQETMEMLKAYEDQNVEAVICTPHFGPCAIPGVNVESAFEWLKSTSKDVKMYLGNEILLTSLTLQDVRRGRARTMNNTDWILIEFEEWLLRFSAKEILACVKWMACSEYKIILAHPERYTDLQFHPRICDQITKAGVKLQINAYDICENKDEHITRLTQYLLKKKLVSFIGSDAHGMHRFPALTNGVKWIYDNCPKDYADAIVHDNAERIIKEGEA